MSSLRNVPKDLRLRRQWVLWREEKRDGNLTKIPYQPGGRRASSTDLATWSTFEEVVKCLPSDKYDGIGFVFSSADPYVGVDLDDCIQDNGIEPWATEIIEDLRTYTEVSPSGGGMHSVCRGKKPGGCCQAPMPNGGKLEVYDSERYLTFTGEVLDPNHGDVADRAEEIKALYYEHLEPRTNGQPKVPVGAGAGNAAAGNGNKLNNEEVIERARTAGNGDDFAQLWNGDTSKHDNDQSRADLALCGSLAFWTGGDPEQMDQLFRQSGLMRPKWDEPRGALTYGERTIRKALEGRTEFYDPDRQSRGGDGQSESADNVDVAVKEKKVKKSSSQPKFWRTEEGKDGGEKIKIDHSLLIDWLEGQGFRKAYEYNQEESTKIRRKKNVLKFYSDEQIKDFVLNYARRLSDKRVLAQLRRAANVYLGSKTFGSLRPTRPTFQRDGKEEGYFYYQNGVVRVTPTEMKLLPYSDLDGVVWQDQIINREVNLIGGYNTEDALSSEIGTFMWRAMKEDDSRMQTLMTANGYAIHGFKNPAHAKAIIFMDEVISDDPAGRSGKGLCGQAYAQMTPTTQIDARRVDLDSQFAFQSVNPGVTRLIHFNDAGNRFPFERLFASITDDLDVEKKNRDRVTIPFCDSPKFLISTNYVISGRGGSHSDRVFEVEFGDYFNADYTPEDEFGHLLFHEWSEEEWNRFDNFMLHCLQYYLRHGLVPYEHVNLAWKKFVQATSPEFADFVQTFEFVANAPGTPGASQQRYDKHGLLDTFTEEYRKDVSTHKLTSWLKDYAEYRGWTLKNRLGTGRDQIAFIDPEAS